MSTYLNISFYLLITSLIGVTWSGDLQAEQMKQHQYIHSNVLGTSFEMSIDAPLAQADAAEKNVLIEIKRLEHIFSTYDNSSEVNLLNQINNKAPSNDLLAVVRLCEAWQKKLPKSFSCKLGNVIKTWQKNEKQQTRPNRVEIRAQARQAQQSSYTSEDLAAGKHNADYTWNFGGIAKGYILDKALAVAKISALNARAIKLDIGGDGVYSLTPNVDKKSWSIGLAIPSNIDDSQENNLGVYNVINGALAYSGHNSRARKIGRRSYSHILTPRDGWPAHNPISTIVKAPDATSADAIATALATTEISTALDWLEKNPIYAALLIDGNGRQYASTNWYQHYSKTEEETCNCPEKVEAKISFSLPKLAIAQYRKPYVAIWIEDEKRSVIKNLLILGQSEQWMRENRSWWRIQGRKSPNLLDGFARPTRRPGEYQLSWNGRDDFGQKLKNGQYKLFAEVAREHGGHEKISLTFRLGDPPQTVSKKGKSEIETLTFQTL